MGLPRQASDAGGVGPGAYDVRWLARAAVVSVELLGRAWLECGEGEVSLARRDALGLWFPLQVAGVAGASAPAHTMGLPRQASDAGGVGPGAYDVRWLARATIGSVEMLGRAWLVWEEGEESLARRDA